MFVARCRDDDVGCVLSFLIVSCFVIYCASTHCEIVRNKHCFKSALPSASFFYWSSALQRCFYVKYTTYIYEAPRDQHTYPDYFTRDVRRNAFSEDPLVARIWQQCSRKEKKKQSRISYRIFQYGRTYLFPVLKY